MIRKLEHLEIPRFGEKTLKTQPFHPITLVLENIRSAENVGSIFRTGDAFRIEQIILVGISPTPETSKLHRSALGAQDTVPWKSSTNLSQDLADLKAQGYTIAALEITDQPKDTKSLEGKDFPLCLVIGNEVDGVSETTLTHCDIALEIQQFGFKQSLNVAVATGICCAELVSSVRELNPKHLILPQNPREALAIDR